MADDGSDVTSALKAPTREQFRECARELGLNIPEADEEWFHQSVSSRLEGLKRIDKMPDFLPEVKYPRTPGRFPTKEENPLNAWYVKTTIEGAKGADLPLSGRTVVMKDNICVAGVPMMNGSAILEGYVPDVDATVVQRVLDAGATVVGKAHCEDLCVSIQSHTNAKGPCKNPHLPTHTTGGSSSGCAALVAAGEVDMAVGGDQGGSIRVPASFCGLYGLKPTYGLVPYTGIFGIQHGVDHVGPITRSTRDCALLLSALAGPDGLDARQGADDHFPTAEELASPTQQPLPSSKTDYLSALEEKVGDAKIGVLTDGFRYAEPVVKKAVYSAIERLGESGAHVYDESTEWHQLGGALWSAVGYSQSILDECFGNAHGEGYKQLYVTSLCDKFSQSRAKQADRVSDNAKLAFIAAKYIEKQYGSHFHAKGNNLARQMTREYDRLLAKVDVLVMPTSGVVAGRLPTPNTMEKNIARRTAILYNTTPFDVTGHPAISIPCGKTKSGLPIGLMLVARKGGERTLLKWSQHCEDLLDWENEVFDEELV